MTLFSFLIVVATRTALASERRMIAFFGEQLCFLIFHFQTTMSIEEEEIQGYTTNFNARPKIAIVSNSYGPAPLSDEQRRAAAASSATSTTRTAATATVPTNSYGKAPASDREMERFGRYFSP